MSHWKVTLVEALFFVFVMRYFILSFQIFQAVAFLHIGNIVMSAQSDNISVYLITSAPSWRHCMINVDFTT